jgi:hypothetical protein
MCGKLPLLHDWMCAGRRYRESEAESRAALGRVRHPDALAVSLDEGPSDRQPEACTSVALTAGEQPEDLVTPLCGNARTLV